MSWAKLSREKVLEPGSSEQRPWGQCGIMTVQLVETQQVVHAASGLNAGQQPQAPHTPRTKSRVSQLNLRIIWLLSHGFCRL